MKRKSNPPSWTILVVYSTKQTIQLDIPALILRLCFGNIKISLAQCNSVVTANFFFFENIEFLSLEEALKSWSYNKS